MKNGWGTPILTKYVKAEKSLIAVFGKKHGLMQRVIGNQAFLGSVPTSFLMLY